MHWVGTVCKQEMHAGQCNRAGNAVASAWPNQSGLQELVELMATTYLTMAGGVACIVCALLVFIWCSTSRQKREHAQA